MHPAHPFLGSLLAAAMAAGLATGQGAPPELPFGSWEMSVKSSDDKTTIQLRLHLTKVGKGQINARTKPTEDHAAGFEFRLEQRGKQPILVIRKCTFLNKGAETIVPFRVEAGRLRLQGGKIDCPVGEVDLKGEWKRAEEK
jgi:hypothetical protein